MAHFTLRRLSHYVTLNWQPGPAAADGDVACYYVLYRFGATETPTPNDPRRILALPRPAPGYPGAFIDTAAVPGVAYAYYLTAVDRLHNESRPTRLISNGLQPAEVLFAQAPEPEAPPETDPAPVAVAAPAPPNPAATPAAPPGGFGPSVRPGGAVKIKVKEKPARRGFFARLFGGG